MFANLSLIPISCLCSEEGDKFLLISECSSFHRSLSSLLFRWLFHLFSTFSVVYISYSCFAPLTFQKSTETESGGGHLTPHTSDVLDMPVDPNEPTYCLCHQVSYGEMIGCDNELCPIEWFHFACVGLTTKPKGKWFCPKCSMELKKKNK